MEKRGSRTLLDRLVPQRWRMRRDWDRRARENAQYFIACGHSQTDAAFWASGERDLTELVLHDVALEPDARALEIGCGVGRLLRPFSTRVGRVHGCDISAEMIERGRQLLADCPNVQLFVTSGRLKPIPGASLDFVYSFIVFQHVSTKSAVSEYIREAARVLRGGARSARLRRRDLWGEGTHYLRVTAVRRSVAARPDTGAVRCATRRWDRDRLEATLRRMDCDPRVDLESVVQGGRSLRGLAERFLSQSASLAPQEFVRRAYEVLLGRDADEGGLAIYAREISGGIPQSNTVDCLISSSELKDRLRPRVQGGPM